jgi:two-component system chemotaxis response regulator CheY
MPGKVLIVDDDHDYCEIMKFALEKSGCEVTVRHDPTSGLTALRGVQPDFLILDVHMPRGGGQLMYDTVRKDSTFKDIPIVVATAAASTDELQTMTGSHPKTLVLRKPLDPDQLVSLVKRSLNRA